MATAEKSSQQLQGFHVAELRRLAEEGHRIHYLIHGDGNELRVFIRSINGKPKTGFAGVLVTTQRMRPRVFYNPNTAIVDLVKELEGAKSEISFDIEHWTPPPAL